MLNRLKILNLNGVCLDSNDWLRFDSVAKSILISVEEIFIFDCDLVVTKLFAVNIDIILCVTEEVGLVENDVSIVVTRERTPDKLFFFLISELIEVRLELVGDGVVHIVHTIELVDSIKWGVLHSQRENGNHRGCGSETHIKYNLILIETTIFQNY